MKLFQLVSVTALGVGLLGCGQSIRPSVRAVGTGTTAAQQGSRHPMLETRLATAAELA